jgi:hypothetical protein
VRQQAAGLQAQLLLDLGDGGQMAEDDQAHAARINEIRACSKVRSSRNPQIYARAVVERQSGVRKSPFV